MNITKLTNSFGVRTIDNLEDLKKYKIAQLKEVAQKIIEEKFPMYKQLNYIRSTTVQISISNMRSRTNAIEQKILDCQEKESLDLIRTDYGGVKRQIID